MATKKKSDTKPELETQVETKEAVKGIGISDPAMTEGTYLQKGIEEKAFNHIDIAMYLDKFYNKGRLEEIKERLKELEAIKNAINSLRHTPTGDLVFKLDSLEESLFKKIKDMEEDIKGLE